MKSLLLWTSAATLAGWIGVGASGTTEPPKAHQADQLAPKIQTDDLEVLLAELCNPYLEGRDSPSYGLSYTAQRIGEHLESFGCKPVGEGGLIHTYELRRAQADAARCSFEVLSSEVAEPATEEQLAEAGLADGWQLNQDFTPLLGAGGEAEGLLQFCGYGIDVRGYRGFDDLELEGRIAVFVEGEPRHKRVLEGPELSPAANTFRKLQRLEHEGAEGALIIRRAPDDQIEPPPGWPEHTPVEFRSTWASWLGERPGARGPVNLPSMEIGWEQAQVLLGLDLEELVGRIDSKGKPQPIEHAAVEVHFESRAGDTAVQLPNVMAAIEGSDPELSKQWVLLGAHFDHIGVDPRGRVAVGADDNASGVSAMLEVAHSLAADPPPRSILLCAFSSEEDGLFGSQAVALDPPVPPDRIAAMVNLDMVGRGPDKTVVALGVRENPDFESILKRAKRRSKSGISKIETKKAQELFARSDHYSFHRRGYPALFLFEQPDVDDNPDYHSYRDVLEELKIKKVERVAKLADAVVRELAELEEPLPRPSGR